MFLKDFFDYKSQLMMEFCSSKEIIQLLTNDEDPIVPNKSMVYTHIWPYEYVPTTVTESQSFICCDVDVDRVNNKTFLNSSLYVWVFCQESSLILPDGKGVRTDALASEVDKLLNGNRYFGLGTLDLKAVKRFKPASEYQGRVLIYSISEFNIPGASRKPPLSRKIHGDAGGVGGDI